MSRQEKLPAAKLVLADGRTFNGHAFGALKSQDNPALGEVVFNTSLYGYQEIVTDPSYAGQIMTYTCPHIGNVGCNPQDNESSKVHVEGVIIRNTTSITSNYRARQSFDSYLKDAGIMGIAGIDTRALVQHLRDEGAQMGAFAAGTDIDASELQAAATGAGSMLGKNYVPSVSCKEVYSWQELPWSIEKNGFPVLAQNEIWNRPHCIAIDYGIKRNILRRLLEAGFRVTVAPASSSVEDIMALRPDALFLSNGPGDPATLTSNVEVIRSLLGTVPVFGICLGHQILAQAFGGETFKLKFGHRGGNHPVRDEITGKVEITVQNHGFAVAADKLPADVEITHINLNDNTVEGLQSEKNRAFSVQYHPEAAPGPTDSSYLFTRFFEMVVS